ncbi:MAG: putative Acyl transferase/acyl hydrolase/lysophospholipase/patatin [Bacteroidota bacterium]|nr:putative Acyl transferase/acyl hydrolase/lysophospholipase/patatin [Bacteroidota bacterium]
MDNNFETIFKKKMSSKVPFNATTGILSSGAINMVRHLSLEGGGGKGVVYLGVARALEEIFSTDNIAEGILASKKLSPNNSNILPAKLPKFNNNLFYPLIPAERRYLKGISGASAGAITAFMLAIGMSTEDVIAEMNKTITMKFQSPVSNILSTISSLVQNLPKSILLLGGGINTSWIKKLFEATDLEVSMFETFLTGPDISSKNETFFLHKIVEKGTNEYSFQNLTGYKKVLAHLSLDEWVYAFSNWVRTILAPIIAYLKLNDSNSSVLMRQLVTDKKTENFVYNLLFTRGIFSGIQTRKYFASLIKTYLYDRYKDIKNVDNHLIIPAKPIDPEKITFKELFAITGVDFVLTGVNTTRKRSLYFSYKHTPDFPVIEAVQISMNIPFLFKPIWVNYEVDMEDTTKTAKYNGLWVDGGMLNNFPIHAFDKIKSENVSVQERNINFPLSQESYNYTEMNNDTCGFRLSKNIPFNTELEKKPIDKVGGKVKYKDGEKLVKIYDENNPLILIDFISDIYDTLLEPSEEGQIRTPAEREHILEIDTGDLGMTDFSTPSLDGKRGNPELGKTKVKLIKTAFVDTIVKFGGNAKSSIEFTKTWKPFPTVNADIQ